MKPFIPFVCIAVLIASCILAAINFVRLETRSVAPHVPEVCLFVGLPVLFGMAALIVLVKVPHQIDFPRDSGPAAPPAVKPVGPKPGPTPLVAHESHEAADRAHVWAILDELSEAMRDDEPGSEALFIVRERYHKLQFSPRELSETTSTAAA